jgi:glutathione peroxidase
MFNIIFSLLAYTLTNFYSLSFQNIDGVTVNMSNFQGKKVLISNIATASPKAIQLAGLQQLQQQYGDSLVVILFPSNSFGNENMGNSEIKNYCDTAYHSTFILAAKSNVAGSNTNPIFAWLSNRTQNGQMDAVAGTDFLKFLIDKDGALIGMFSSKISPTDPDIIRAITTTIQ